MAQACNAQALAALVPCNLCAIPAGFKPKIMVALLAKIAGVPVNAQYLASLVPCDFCAIPIGLKYKVMIALLCQIANGGSGGGGNTFSFASLVWDNPPDAPSNTGSQNTYSGASVIFSATQVSGPVNEITNSNTNSPLNYSGPGTTGNVKLVLTNTSVVNNGLVQIVQGSNLLLNQVLTKTDGTYNYPFTLAASSGSAVVVTVSWVLGGGNSGITATAAVTLTP